MHDFIVCSIFKNESHILDEWISHYLFHGVDHIYLVNDFSTDSYLEIIEKYADRVTLFHNDIVTKEVGRQTQIYRKYFTSLLSSAKWMSILDLDEFLYSPETINIKQVLSEYSEYAQIIVDWVHFGSNEHVLQPNSAVEGFTMRALSRESVRNVRYHGYKSIFKCEHLQNFDIHTSNVNGDVLRIIDTNAAKLLINHYNVQSLEFFINVKGTRGDVNNWFDHVKLQRNKELFAEFDVNDLEDLRLCNQNRDIIKQIKHNKLSKTDDVTMVITSCNRPHLLDKTLESFIKYNTYPISKTILLDDSGIIGCNEPVVEKYKGVLNITSLYNKENMSQIKSIDKLYSYVRTKYVFHCEEDWDFLQPQFIEKSKQVFDENPDEKIFTVWLRPHHETSAHPITFDNKKRGYYEMQRDFSYISKGIEYTWCGVTFNPGLRKTEDIYVLHPLFNHCKTIVKNGKTYPMEGEYTINDEYRKRGYFAYILDDPHGHVNHIGWESHIETGY